jgi:hypothetical protein
MNPAIKPRTTQAGMDMIELPIGHENDVLVYDTDTAQI